VNAEAHEADDETGVGTSTGSILAAAPDMVEVRRNGGLSALVGAAASAVAIAYLGRAVQTGAALDWILVAVMGVLGAIYLHAFVDARTPLLVADSQGVRIRLGRAWRGMPWGALAAVEHTPRPGLLRDGRLVLVPRNPERVLGELDPSGRRQSRLSEKLYGAPFALPLGLSTRVTGNPGHRGSGDLTTALRQLAGSSARVVELVPGTSEAAEQDVEIVEPGEPRTGFRLPDPRPSVARLISGIAAVFTREVVEDVEVDVPDDEKSAEDETDGRRQRREAKRAERAEKAEQRAADKEARRAEREEAAAARAAEREALEAEQETEDTVPIAASPTPAPLREPRTGTRTEVRATAPIAPEPVEGRELRRPGSINLVEENQTWGDRVRPLARPGSSVEPLVIDDFEVAPAEDPVIGPELAAARTRIGLNVDQLADRTRIRPHVIESIEVDDFAPCGGDFYARGHLRTLSRVLGVDVTPLLAAYDERYADAPINPRRVFEAELATGAYGGIRSTRGGPNWSLLVAAVMAVVLCWSIARLVMDDPQELIAPAPVAGDPRSGDGIPNFSGTVPVRLRGVGPGTHAEVRNKEGEVLFSGFLAQGEVKALDVMPPVQVTAADGHGVRVAVAGKAQGFLGPAGEPAEETFRD